MEHPIKRPLTLLGLPLDVLKAILKEVTQTNDLTTLALTNSTLHELVTPIIYSRFDIVWPDALNSTEPRTGVDALTFGLATLVMRHDLFEVQPRLKSVTNDISQNPVTDPSCSSGQSPTQRHIRRGNFYSHFVKKFSIGNGPPELVQDYVITRDSGKLLGTMVALAIARMPNLEAFVWDMPTGLLRDVWMALSSLGDRHPPKLDMVYVRFHDNKKAFEESGLVRSTGASANPATAATGELVSLGLGSASDAVADSMVPRFFYSCQHVECPNFSVLPPLRSISAVDIDEIANLSELSLLIGKSMDKLRGLRVGMSPSLSSSGLPADHRALKYLLIGPPGKNTLSLLFSGLPQCRLEGRWRMSSEEGKREWEPFIDRGDIVETGPSQIQDSVPNPTVLPQSSTASSCPPEISDSEPVNAAVDVASIDPVLKSRDVETAGSKEILSLTNPSTSPDCVPSPDDLTQHQHQTTVHLPTLSSSSSEKPKLPERLKSHVPPALQLTTLELEGHYLLVPVLRKAVDFSCVTSLTLLGCSNATSLWSYLRDNFVPRKQSFSPIVSTMVEPKDNLCKSSTPRLRRMPASSRTQGDAPLTYRLNLKRLHTDTVSAELVLFLKQTLAPNSLEWLFLQDCAQSRSTVTLNQIYKSVLRRHKASLTKVMLDSASGAGKSRSRSAAARKWTVDRETLSSFLAPRKAPRLRELSISLEYKDWHWFLQRLPNTPTLRSLHIPFIADHVWGSSYSVRDVAMGVLDVINLRQECQLAYLAITDKCFEIVETKAKTHKRRGSEPAHLGADDTDDDSSEDDITPHISDDDDDDDDLSDDDTTAQDGGGMPESDHAGDEWEDDLSSSSDDEDDLEASARRQQQTKMKLREILFYDDKISIFRARHGKL